MSNWLEKYRKDSKKMKGLGERTRKASQSYKDLPPIKFSIDLPYFVRTVGPSRIAQTRWGPRELVDIMVTGSLDPAFPEGEEFSMWITQTVFVTKMESFRDASAPKIKYTVEDPEEQQEVTIVRKGVPSDLDLYVFCHGMVKGGAYGRYWDYTILPAEEGKKLLEGE